jgi:uncharacterized Zn finger protein
VVTDRKSGLFPLSDEISFDCDCPDWATMCKHVAAVLYGVGARLDQDPSLLFRLRGVNHDELIDLDTQHAVPTASRRGGAKRLASNNLSDVFGIDIATDEPKPPLKAKGKAKGKAKKTASRKKTTAKKKKAAAKKKTAGVKKKATVRRPKKKTPSRKEVATDRGKGATPRKSAKTRAAKKKVKKRAK